MTISAGATIPAVISLCRIRKPCLLRIESGNVTIPDEPRLRSITGLAAAISTPPESTRLSTGRRITARVTQVQNRPLS